jgi:hypothetical protein
VPAVEEHGTISAWAFDPFHVKLTALRVCRPKVELELVATRDHREQEVDLRPPEPEDVNLKINTGVRSPSGRSQGAGGVEFSIATKDVPFSCFHVFYLSFVSSFYGLKILRYNPAAMASTETTTPNQTSNTSFLASLFTPYHSTRAKRSTEARLPSLKRRIVVSPLDTTTDPPLSSRNFTFDMASRVISFSFPIACCVDALSEFVNFGIQDIGRL